MTRLFALAQVRLTDLFAALRREEGQGMTEYAVVLAFVVAGAALIGTGLWLAIDGKFTTIINGI